MYKNEDGKETRECVACGYSDIMKDELPESATNELTTRVTPEGKVVRDDGEQAIRIFENPNVKH